MKALSKTLSVFAATLIAAALGAAPAMAKGTSDCGVSGVADAPSTIDYDPFSGVALTQISIPLTLTRVVGPNGEKTQQVNFVLTKPVGAPAYEVTYNGASILYTEGATQGHPQIDSQAAGEVNYNFGGATQPDSVLMPYPLVVTVPAGTDLSAGEPIDFDILFVCKGTGNLQDVSTPTPLSGAIHINVNVLTALQASYVGSTLDFGEVGDKTTADVLAAPNTYSTSDTLNNIRVASSGPYKVEVASQNGYKLTFPGGNLGTPGETLDYEAFFLGQTLSPSAPTFTTTTCVRAGISGKNLPIKATLLEGGRTKTPAANYQDVITVTLSPLLDGATGQVDCP